MKILIVSQYFWPEKFRINDVANYLIIKGHQVEVLTGKPNYPDVSIYNEFKKNEKKYNNFFGVNIIRIPIFLRGDGSPLRLFINYLSFILSSIIIGTYKIRKKKYDIIFTFATSPITVALPSIFFALIKNSKHVLWVLDIWPEILKELKIVKNKYLIFFLKKIVNFIYDKSDIILAQSKSFKKIISKIVSDEDNVHYFPVWSEDLDIKKNDENILLEFREYKNKFNIIFTGNIGEAQNFEKIIEAANFLKHEKDLQWLIIGTGRKINEYSELIKKNKINNFYFIGYKSNEKIKSFHEMASVLLISLSEGKYLSATIPGKLQTYLKSNKYILGFIDGSAAEIIKESKAGIVVEPSNAKKLAETIFYLKDNPNIIKEVVLNNYGPKYLEKKFNKNYLLNKLEKQLIKIIKQIKLIKDVEDLPMNENFSLSGLNLAFLGYLIKKKIKIYDNTYLWPDGIFYKRFFNNKFLKKIPGRDIVSKIKIPTYIQRIFVLGNLEIIAKNYLENHLKRNIFHINLPFDSVSNLYNRYCKIQFLDTDLIFLTLPTPQQEELAALIMKNSRFYKIICVGGAINMASGVEKSVPQILEKLNLEFLWRLRTDTKRRMYRLIVSIFYYLIGEITFKFKNLDKKIINEKK